MSKFYNYLSHGLRYKFNGKYLYEHLTNNDNKLQYVEITNTNNIILSKNDWLYYYFSTDGICHNTNCIGRDPKLDIYVNKIYQYNKYSQMYPDSIIVDYNNIYNKAFQLINKFGSIYVTLEYGFSGLTSYIINKNNISTLKDIYNRAKSGRLRIRLSKKLNIVENYVINVILFCDGYIMLDLANQYIVDYVKFNGNYYPANASNSTRNICNR